MGKLVRDRIPEIMRKEGKTPAIRKVEGNELRQALKDKLVEEAGELRQAENISEELADVLEVIDALIDAYGLNLKEIASLKERKKIIRGSFRNGSYLVDGTDGTYT